MGGVIAAGYSAIHVEHDEIRVRVQFPPVCPDAALCAEAVDDRGKPGVHRVPVMPGAFCHRQMDGHAGSFRGFRDDGGIAL